MVVQWSFARVREIPDIEGEIDAIFVVLSVFAKLQAMKLNLDPAFISELSVDFDFHRFMEASIGRVECSQVNLNLLVLAGIAVAFSPSWKGLVETNAVRFPTREYFPASLFEVVSQ